MPSPHITVLPALTDNYIYLLADAGEAVAVDPGTAAPVLSRLQTDNMRLRSVILTHQHADHTAGADELRRATGCTVIGPAECAACMLDQTVADGDTILLGTHRLRVLAVSGHTPGHVVYHHETAHQLWTGDTLFAAGCGRIQKGAAAQMWHSLQRLRALPPQTRIYFGHEYTLDNLEFACSILPHDPDLRMRLEKIRKMNAAGQPTTPTTMEIERRTNLFLRADDETVHQALGMPAGDPVAIFAELRRRKDAW